MFRNDPNNRSLTVAAQKAVGAATVRERSAAIDLLFHEGPLVQLMQIHLKRRLE